MKNWPVMTKNFRWAVSSNHIKHEIYINNGMLRLQSVTANMQGASCRSVSMWNVRPSSTKNPTLLLPPLPYRSDQTPSHCSTPSNFIKNMKPNFPNSSPRNEWQWIDENNRKSWVSILKLSVSDCNHSIVIPLTR